MRDDQTVAGALFDAVQGWFADRDIHKLRGPVNPSMNHEFGLLVDGFDSPPTFMMTYNHGRGCIYLNLVRVEYMKSRALDMAENDEVQCPSSITEFGRNQENKRVYLDAEGRTPQPQDEEGRRLEEANAAILFHDLGFTSEKGTDPTEKDSMTGFTWQEGMDEMDEWE